MHILSVSTAVAFVHKYRGTATKRAGLGLPTARLELVEIVCCAG